MPPAVPPVPPASTPTGDLSLPPDPPNVARLVDKKKGPKPIDRWLGIGGIVVGILLFLLPKTPVVVIASLITIFVLLWHPVWNFWWIERSLYRRLGALLVLAFVLIWIGPTLQDYTSAEIAEFASKRVMAISPGERPITMRQLKTFTASAFWISNGGLAATCSSSISPASRFTVTIPATPGIRGPVKFFGGGLMVEAAIYKQNDDGLTIVSVPFVAEIQRKRKTLPPPPKSKYKPASTVYDDQVFSLANTFPSVGEKIFIYGLEESITLPSFSIHEGHINRLGLGSHVLTRAYADILSTGIYCGSPVLNETKVVIGMVVGNTQRQEAEILTSVEILELMENK
jgi:hypothetical protein